MNSIKENLSVKDFKNFHLKTLEVNSKHLKGNYWKDPVKRHNPVLVPKKKQKTYPLVLILSGFTGNGPKNFNFRGFESNFPEVIDEQVSQKKAPTAIYVFVDAWTFWGGSQFIDSPSMGKYESYLVKEVYKALTKELPVDSGKVCVFGGSSGGYGALHLSSKYPELFPYAVAIAPDSFFDMSLLPEIYSAFPAIDKMGGVMGVKQEIDEGRFFKRRNSHTILNVIAMGLCYSATNSRKKEVRFPIDESGNIIKKVWGDWKKHDPLVFLEKRKAKIKKIKRVFVDVGKQDQFHLQYGSRQIKELLEKYKVSCDYSEFPGNHFDISSRRPKALQWLLRRWG